MKQDFPEISRQRERIHLQGDFTFLTVGRAWISLKRMLRHIPQTDVWVDLQGVKQADSACLALLLALLREITKKGKSLHFTHIPDKMLALARVGGVATILFNLK